MRIDIPERRRETAQGADDIDATLPDDSNRSGTIRIKLRLVRALTMPRFAGKLRALSPIWC